MRAYLLARHGSPSVLQLSEVPTPEPGRGEVRVRLRAIGVNFAEVLSRRGLYGWAPRLPYVPGMEGAGEIEALGPGVTGRRIGEPVIVGAQRGCYAQAVVVPAHQALPALPELTLHENAALAVNYLTAWVSLMEMARLRPADRLLVQAAAGGVGTAAVQLAAAFGCTVYGTAGADGKLPLVKRLGAEAAINYRTTDFEAEIRRLTGGRGVDVVLETVGGEVFRKSLRLLAPTGRVVVVGFASLAFRRWDPRSWWRTWRDIPRARVGELAQHSTGLLAVHLGHLLPERDRLAGIWAEMIWYLKRHRIRPVVGSTFPFVRMAEAHALLESRRSTGKIIVEADR